MNIEAILRLILFVCVRSRARLMVEWPGVGNAACSRAVMAAAGFSEVGWSAIGMGSNFEQTIFLITPVKKHLTKIGPRHLHHRQHPAVTPVEDKPSLQWTSEPHVPALTSFDEFASGLNLEITKNITEFDIFQHF
ncbi:hypothetical protein HW555_010990 [Spodoptera exigua]|uniref:Uncharacterized protein n=1 Tax=Spodoptera exigua TaxID=7107 RepID=A0A835G677_SPOEX|nr:hypothetical protein HW555_010990 [Spodoptera exigua]